MAKKKVANNEQGEQSEHREQTEQQDQPRGQQQVAPHPSPPTIRNRIIDYRTVPASSISPHPQNARLHPHRQRRAVRRELEQLGFVDALIVRELPNGALEMLDGHLRREETGDAPVPVIVVDLDDAEAARFLRTFDKTGELAEWDLDTLAKLCEMAPMKDEEEGQDLYDKAFLEKFAAEQRAKAEAAEAAEAAARARGGKGGVGFGGNSGSGQNQSAASHQPPTSTDPNAALATRGIYALMPDAIFPSTNYWGIPDLDPAVLSDAIPKRAWEGEQLEPGGAEGQLIIYTKPYKGMDCTGGILAFYLDDEHFEKIRTEAPAVIATLCQQDWKAIVSPDFSTWRDDPLAIQLWNLYRSRWVARYWQDVGIPIIPNLSFGDERTYDFAFSTIPHKPPVIAVQCRTSNSKSGDPAMREESRKLMLNGLRAGIEAVEPQNVLIYGGAEHYNWFNAVAGGPKLGELPKGPEYHYYYSWRTLIGNQQDRQKEKSSHYPGVKC